jgi:hypothetical protein
VSNWHPILAADEIEPGTWLMRGPLDEPYAVVRAVEIRSDRGYRSVTYAPESADRELIGYYRTLRAATKGAHVWWVATRSPAGHPGPAYA